MGFLSSALLHYQYAASGYGFIDLRPLRQSFLSSFFVLSFYVSHFLVNHRALMDLVARLYDELA